MEILKCNSPEVRKDFFKFDIHLSHFLAVCGGATIKMLLEYHVFCDILFSNCIFFTVYWGEVDGVEIEIERNLKQFCIFLL